MNFDRFSKFINYIQFKMKYIVNIINLILYVFMTPINQTYTCFSVLTHFDHQKYLKSLFNELYQLSVHLYVQFMVAAKDHLQNIFPKSTNVFQTDSFFSNQELFFISRTIF